MNSRFALLSLLPIAVAAAACAARTLDVGTAKPGSSDSAITYVGGCQPGSCGDPQTFACAGGPVMSLACAPDPNAGTGSDPAGHCVFNGQCPSFDAEVGPVSSADASASAGITYVGGCQPDSCSHQAFACAGGAAIDLQCAPDPNAGQGSDPAGHCVLGGQCQSATDASVESADASAESTDASVETDDASAVSTDASVDAG